MIHFRLYAVPVVQEPTGLMSHLVLLYYLSKNCNISMSSLSVSEYYP